MKTKFKTLANLQAADVAAIAIRSLVQSIRNATPSLKVENMDTALAYYDVTVGECAKSPIELGLTLQTSGNFQKSIRSAMLQVNDRRRKPY